MIYRSFLEKRTKSPGTCECPRTPYNAAQVWNALYATNREKLQTVVTMFLRTVIFPRFSQAYRHLPAVLALALCLLSAYSAIIMWGFSPHPCGLMWASAPTRPVCSHYTPLPLSRKIIFHHFKLALLPLYQHRLLILLFDFCFANRLESTLEKHKIYRNSHNKQGNKPVSAHFVKCL